MLGVIADAFSKPARRDRAVAGDEYATPLVASRGQLEEQMCRIGLERPIAEFVGDRQYRFAKVGEQYGLGIGNERGDDGSIVA
jgi:hypothetical protein